MKGILATALAAGLLAGASAPALAVDGHGNADKPELAAPNTGNVSGGPTHRDDPRVREAQEKGPDGRSAHSAKDGHNHGHGHK